MIRLAIMSIQDLLNRKYFEWQIREGKKTVEEFADLFGVSQGLVSMWMNGKRNPGPKHKQKIIEMYGEEAILAFGDDPDFYAVQQNWEHLSPEQRRAFSRRAREQAQKNDKTSQHRTRTAE